jgi:hypothetical protein
MPKNDPLATAAEENRRMDEQFQTLLASTPSEPIEVSDADTAE